MSVDNKDAEKDVESAGIRDRAAECGHCGEAGEGGAGAGAVSGNGGGASATEPDRTDDVNETVGDESSSGSCCDVDSERHIEDACGDDGASGTGHAGGEDEDGDEEEEPLRVLRGRLDELERELASTREKLKVKSEQLVRLAADFDNYKKRARRDCELGQAAFAEKLFTKLLPTLDAMDRAKESVEAGDDLEHLREGLAQIHSLFRQALKDVGVVPMDVLGTTFDPRYHEALMHHPMPGAEPGTVTVELQRGWMLGERVLRAARVGVAPDEPEPVDTDDDDTDGTGDGEAAGGVDSTSGEPESPVDGGDAERDGVMDEEPVGKDEAESDSSDAVDEGGGADSTDAGDDVSGDERSREAQDDERTGEGGDRLEPGGSGSAEQVAVDGAHGGPEPDEETGDPSVEAGDDKAAGC